MLNRFILWWHIRNEAKAFSSFEKIREKLIKAIEIRKQRMARNDEFICQLRQSNKNHRDAIAKNKNFADKLEGMMH